MREHVIKLYQFDELSEKAKDRARAWFRRGTAEEFDPDTVLTDADEMARILGITITKPIGWSLDWSHHPGAAYTGTYGSPDNSVASRVSARIAAEAPPSEDCKPNQEL